MTEGKLVEALRSIEHKDHGDQLREVALRSAAVGGIDVKRVYKGKLSEDVDFMNNLFQARFEQAARSPLAAEQKDLLVFAMDTHRQALQKGFSLNIYQANMRGTILQAQLVVNARTGNEII